MMRKVKETKECLDMLVPGLALNLNKSLCEKKSHVPDPGARKSTKTDFLKERDKRLVCWEITGEKIDFGGLCNSTVESPGTFISRN